MKSFFHSITSIMSILSILFIFLLLAGCSFDFNFYPGTPGLPPPPSDPPKVFRLGYIPDKPDATDTAWQLPADAKTIIPERIDLSPLFPPVYDQGDLGSCTAQALAAAADCIKRQQGQPYLFPSRLFIYYNEREAEGTTAVDAGARLQSGVKALMRLGVCPESSWQYDVKQFARKPPGNAYTEAMNYQALQYAKIPVPNLILIKQTLANHYPICFGFEVFPSFMEDSTAKSGICPMPKKSERRLGGHAVVLVGYDDKTSMFRVRNSWGTQWGQQGYFDMPYEFLTKYARDFWVIRKME